MMRVGTKAEQREGLEYEFDLVASMDLQNELTVVKSRCPALSGEIVSRPGRVFAETFKAWLDDGEPAAPSGRDVLLERIGKADSKDELVSVWQAMVAADRIGQVTPGDVETLQAAWAARKAQVVAEQTEPSEVPA
jgi:hypothetical protein